MTKQSVTKAMTAALVSALSSCTPAVTPELPVSNPSQSEATVAAEVYQQINAYRRAHGASPLQRNPELDQVARQNSEFLRAKHAKLSSQGGSTSHLSFEGRTPSAHKLHNINQVGENAATTTTSGGNTAAARLVSLWTHAPKQENNLRFGWTDTGVGVVEDHDGMVFATQMFGAYKAPMQRDMLNSLRAH